MADCVETAAGEGIAYQLVNGAEMATVASLELSSS
jgi:hypothetical protein